MTDSKAEFEHAALEVQRLTRRPDNHTLLRLYALYKQATQGDVGGKRPGLTDMAGRAKYDAWSGVKGMASEEAMRQYVQLVNHLKRG